MVQGTNSNSVDGLCAGCGCSRSYLSFKHVLQVTFLLLPVLQSAIAESVWVALVVFSVRLCAIMAGSWLGCKLGGVISDLQRRCFWMSMVTQVGSAGARSVAYGTMMAGAWAGHCVLACQGSDSSLVSRACTAQPVRL